VLTATRAPADERLTPRERRATGKALERARTRDSLRAFGRLSEAAFENAVADFAEAHADVTEDDHRRLADAVSGGRIEARTDL
jgi:hypothetical protein